MLKASTTHDAGCPAVAPANLTRNVQCMCNALPAAAAASHHARLCKQQETNTAAAPVPLALLVAKHRRSSQQRSASNAADHNAGNGTWCQLLLLLLRGPAGCCCASSGDGEGLAGHGRVGARGVAGCLRKVAGSKQGHLRHSHSREQHTVCQCDIELCSSSCSTLPCTPYVCLGSRHCVCAYARSVPCTQSAQFQHTNQPAQQHTETLPCQHPAPPARHTRSEHTLAQPAFHSAVCGPRAKRTMHSTRTAQTSPNTNTHTTQTSQTASRRRTCFPLPSLHT